MAKYTNDVDTWNDIASAVRKIAGIAELAQFRNMQDLYSVAEHLRSHHAVRTP